MIKKSSNGMGTRVGQITYISNHFCFRQRSKGVVFAKRLLKYISWKSYKIPQICVLNTGKVSNFVLHLP